MASACKVFKNGVQIGTGSIAAGSETISSWSAAANTPPIARRNVQVQCTEAGVHVGRTFNTQILADNTTTLTMRDKCPFVGA